MVVGGPGHDLDRALPEADMASATEKGPVSASYRNPGNISRGFSAKDLEFKLLSARLLDLMHVSTNPKENFLHV